MITRALITGHSCTGKSSIRHILTRDWYFDTAVEYTTRPRRPNEANHEDYHFVSDDAFDELEKGLLYTARYQIDKDVCWRYGLSKLFLDNLDHIVTAVIPIKEVINVYNMLPKDQCVVIYLDAPKRVLEERALLRGISNDSFTKRYDRDYPYADDLETKMYIRDVHSLWVNTTGSNRVSAALIAGYLMGKS